MGESEYTGPGVYSYSGRGGGGCSRRLKEEVATVLGGALSFTAKCQIEPLWETYYTRTSVEWHALPGRSQGAFSRFSRLFFF